jgi:hypothetical protein
VTQALERIRQTARQRKKERFTALFHHISVDLLRKAFFALKQDAAPGTDGKIWQDYAADYGEDLELRTPRTLTESRCPVLRRSDSGLWIPVGDEAA